jgi:MFS family permease
VHSTGAQSATHPWGATDASGSAAFGSAILYTLVPVPRPATVERRPIGTIVLGAYGDRMGDRAALVVTIGLMADATGAVGLIPTYLRGRPVRRLCAADFHLARRGARQPVRADLLRDDRWRIERHRDPEHEGISQRAA